MPDLIAKPARWLPGLRDGHPLARGLVGLWPFWEGQGNKAYDIAHPYALGSHGTLMNMDPATDWVGSPTGHALDFDNNDDYVDCGDTPILDQDFTAISLLGIVYTTNGVEDGIIGKDSPWYIAIRATGEGFRFRHDGLSAGNTDLVIPDARNRWAHLAATYDGASVALYHNGVQGISAARTGTIGTNNFAVVIGGVRAGTWIFSGMIALVAAWSRAISANEVAELYADPWGLITPRTKTYIMVTAAPTGITRLAGGDGLFKLAGDGGGLAA